MHIPDRHLRILGWMASLCAIAMYVSYIDQIRLNLEGEKGSLILPLVTVFNCCLWTAYGALKQKADLPIIMANVPGIVLGLVTLVTAL